MRTNLRIFNGFAFCAVWLVSTAALAQGGTQGRPVVTFAPAKTYAFRDTGGSPYGSQTGLHDSQRMRERTDSAIGAQLDARGMRRDNENPDVYVRARRTYDIKSQYWEGSPPYYGGKVYTPNAYTRVSSGYVYTEQCGTLTVGLEDARTGALIWQGAENTAIHETSERSVNDQVSDMFKHLPIGAVATARAR
jgi:hypothetical protein